MIPLIRLVPLIFALLGQTDQKEQARQFLDSCQAGKFTEATASFDAKMKEVLGPVKLEELWKKLGQQLGPIAKMGPPRTDKVGSSTRVKIRCDYKTMPLDALVSFNAQGQIEGFFLNPAEKTADTPDPSYVERSKFTEEPITVGARDWPLPGTLTRPRGVASAPLVILVHGSGPNDRDETLGPNTPFRDLAHGLASRGIAVLRYDKRTFAQKQKLIKEGLDKTITIKEEVIDDVLATLAKARVLSGIDPDRIFVLGHSGGGSLAPVIAQRDGKLAGIILLAASSRPVEEGLREQLSYVKSVDRDQAEAVGKIQKDVEGVFARMKAGTARDDEMIMGAPVRYWKSWQAIDPVRLAGSLKGLPVLVLQGGRDYQVTQADFEGFRTALRGRPDTAFHLYPDLNHLFQKGKGKAVPSEYLKRIPVDPRVIDDIARWVKSIRG
jgi:alpha-beta hydrolase superfamily lysophospholipase